MLRRSVAAARRRIPIVFGTIIALATATSTAATTTILGATVTRSIAVILAADAITIGGYAV